MDEKGFLIGLIHAMRRIVPVSAIKKGLTKGSIQDGLREFITIIAAISATGNVIPPALLYASESGDLQDTWLEDFDETSQVAYFGASQKGWTSDELGLAWLDRFHESSFQISGYQKRLLILDGHGSHCSLDFLLKAVNYNILVVIFPPHSTHRLQPLDISVFRPLAHYYSQGLDDYIQSSRGFSKMSKRLFWSLFYPAWQKATKFEVISSGWAKSGIYPFKPELVLNQITPQQHFKASSDSSSDEELALNVQAARRLTKKVYNEPRKVSLNVELLIKSMDALILQNGLLQRENFDLNSALITKEKHQKKPKPLGLLAAEEPKYG